MDFKIERKSRNTHTIRWQFRKREQSKFDVLLISDLHWDNPHCRRELLEKHLEIAKKKTPL